MENPLDLPVPDDPIERVHAFARVLAYGAAKDYWDSQLSIYYGSYQWSEDQLTLLSKWEDKSPSPYLLVSFEYLISDNPPPNPKGPVPINEAIGLSRGRDFFLSPKAFALLDKPSDAPQVFISYKQKQSSALALLIEARLKLADSDAKIFIDKLLEGGDSWEQTLNTRIRESEYFICLIGPETLVVEANKKNMVRQEIEWALNSECRIIPIWHNGYVPDSNYPSRLETIQAIPVPTESAKGYGSAIDDLLVILGYSTI